MSFSFLSLWLLLASLTSPAPGEQWRLVYRDGTFAALPAAPLLSGDRRADLSSAWAWSDGAAPRRIEADRIGKERLAVDRARLQIQVLDAQALTDARVIAGPQGLWLDVPEDLLPSWPVPRDGRLSIPLDPGQPWRLRLAARGQGSWWLDLPAGRTAGTLAPVAAPDLALLVTDRDGRPVDGAWLRILEGRRGEARPWALHRSIEGRISAPGLPGAEEVAAIVGAPDHVPAVLRGRPGDLPRQVQLGTGATVAGRFIAESGKAVSGVQIRLEAWFSPEMPQLTSRSAKSAADGTWQATAIPPGEAALLARAPGFAPYRLRLALAEGKTDLGTVRLRRGRDVRVEIVNDAGQPLARASLAGPAGLARTDAAGAAVLTVPPGEAFDLEVKASHHLDRKVRVEPAQASPMRIVLERAFLVVGRLVDPQGLPVGEGLSVLRRGNLSMSRSLLPGGAFEIDLPPGVEAELALSSPTTRELRLPLEPGAAGEVRDLGALQAPAGVEILGRIVSAGGGSAEGEPVPGARIWLPRPSDSGLLLAWVDRDLLEARSGADGRFRLAGTTEGPLQLRIDAAGFARAHHSVQPEAEAAQPEADERTLDIGDIVLAEGSTLHIRIPAPKGDGATARADLRGDWLELDMLTAPVFDGEAVLRNVPPGRIRLTVQKGRTLLCERQVAVLPEEDAEVECSGAPIRVRGVVRIGGHPAGPGTLLWMPPPPDMPGRITNVSSPAGLRQQQVFGEGRPQVEVSVVEDGSFVTEDLMPGSWQVAWVPVSGSLSQPQTVEIPELPEGAEHVAVLTFPGGAIAGVVLSPDERPAEGARVRDLDSGSVAFSGSDGGFVLTGVAPGTHHVQAEREELTSAVVSTAVSTEEAAGRSGDPIRLVLGDRQAPEIRVQVFDSHDVPVPGAFVFLEEEGKGQRLLTTGPDGGAAARVDLPTPARVRLAALINGVWSLGAWTDWADLPDPVILLSGPAGSLRVESSALEGSPRILSSQGWDIGWLLTRLGARQSVGPDHPLEMQGLPEGQYTFSLGDLTSRVTVKAGQQSSLALD